MKYIRYTIVILECNLANKTTLAAWREIVLRYPEGLFLNKKKIND